VTVQKQSCQIFLGATYQNGENVPNDHKLYEMATKYIPEGRKIDQIAIKYTKIHIPLQNPPKYNQIGILGLKICHLATLIVTTINRVN
jgi:hypothetical protein